ncbi:peptidoglycan DD-metalloendopeptidase family protein [Desulforamulus ruminis]|uniref:Peptidase M23 n=1 Tax=Desulforamulus ruminis (strain ATCC 23193 / DSM 2154 / NCIMB 8452 / DL) TaxID=696281 RepID=F6DTC4_DESRL|nr:peptidoglycan DD-metalloendopeptidase family protein [Desulforamulus ruminis]AEG58941.1 Peptidase M23 [Desulforamulus ruminis DSM 2154]
MNLMTAAKAAYGAGKIAQDESYRNKMVGILAAIALLAVLGFLLLGMCISAVLSGMVNLSTGFKSGTASNIAKAEIPSELMPVFVNAQEKFGVSWAILAAIAKTETDFGKNIKVSSAGAIGFMQFMPATWQAYKQDGDGDGICDPSNAWDAIYSAANYLQASGFEKNPSNAIYAYNHDWGYVNTILTIASGYSATMVPTGNGIWPLPGYLNITSDFGYRPHPIKKKRLFHEGIDIGAPQGTPIVAAADGRVTMAKYYGGYGLCVQVLTKDCLNVYGHMSGFAVREGQNVRAGQVIGYVGSTGSSTAPHLHFGVYVNNSPCNPKEWLKIESGNR